MRCLELPRVASGTRRIGFYVPVDFDPLRVLPPALHKYSDCANYLVSRVVLGRIFPDRCDANGYVRLHVQTLRMVIPDRVEKTIRETLIGAGVLDHDPHYLRDEKSMGYRLGEMYAKAQTRRVECLDRELRQRLLAARASALPQPVHRHLATWLDRLEIDMEKAQQVVSCLEDAELHLLAAETIAKKDVDYTVCQYGRFHSTVTRLKSELRSALRMEGKPLVSLDIRNSQPLILGMLLLIYRINGDKLVRFPSIKRLVEERIEEYRLGHVKHLFTDEELRQIEYLYSSPLPSTFYNSSSNVPPPPGGLHMMSNTHQTPPLKAVMSLREELSLDERRYLEACEAGLLYETIQEEAGDASLDRNVLKQVIFRDVFFGRNGSNAPFKKTFQRLYPNVMSVVRELKAKDYRNLARLMQKYESSLMIGAICGRIMKERSDMPLVTIHDSVATTEEHYQYLKTIVLEEFRKIGIQPSLKTERWQ